MKIKKTCKKTLLLCLSLSLLFNYDVFAEAKFDPSDLNIRGGYKAEVVVSNLSVPTTAIFDGEDLLIAESGFANTAKPRVIRVTPSGTTTVVASEGLNPPVTGILVREGKVYISHRTKVSVVENGELRDIVTDLPSLGDHQNNQIVLGPDNKIYMGQGTVTNSGVVGEDNYVFGWLSRNKDLHEIPCRDITLVGKNFDTENPLTERDDRANTGAYKPFGTQSQEGEVVKGNVKCGGSIIRFNPDGTGMELVAWGLRNPFGLAFDNSGQLWATYHGADVRGSRGIYNDPDYFVRVEKDAWYGWPEYFNGESVTEEKFDPPGYEKPEFLWKNHPPLTKPFITFASHSAANGFAFAPRTFGFEGDAFVALYGTFAPVTTGVNVRPAGFSVVRVDMKNKKVEEFLSNKLPGPAYINRSEGLNRPSDVAFAPDGSMYVVDWGGSTVTQSGLELVPGTGAIWRIYPESGTALRSQGPVVVAEDLAADGPREPIVPNIQETYEGILSSWVWPIIILIILICIVIWMKRRI